jgi:hypothetical protein
MAGSQEKLGSACVNAAKNLDQRYNGYNVEATKALVRIVKAQSETTSDTQRAREVDRIIESLGELLHANASTQVD